MRTLISAPPGTEGIVRLAQILASEKVKSELFSTPETAIALHGARLKTMLVLDLPAERAERYDFIIIALTPISISKENPCEDSVCNLDFHRCSLAIAGFGFAPNTVVIADQSEFSAVTNDLTVSGQLSPETRSRLAVDPLYRTYEWMHDAARLRRLLHTRSP